MEKKKSEESSKLNISRKYGIMGGTFDPIHLGHLFIAETVFRELKLEKIIFVPTGIPPHKNYTYITSSHDRLLMTAMAINNNEAFFLSDMEIVRKGPSYTIDTIRNLLQQSESPVELYFITGADAFIEIETWKNYEELLKMIKFVVATRAGYDDAVLNNKINCYNQDYDAEIIKMTIPILEISSSDIRQRVREGQSIKYMVSEDVERYIKKNRLYEKIL